MVSRYAWSLPSGCTFGPEMKIEGNGGVNVNMDEIPIVKLRRGGSVEPILSGFQENRVVQITGPPGCGKSTTVPLKLAEATGCLVVHLVPHPMQAMQLVYGRTGKTYLTDQKLIFDPGRTEGVLVMSYTTMVSLILREKKSFNDVSTGLVLYCDESHESDAATYAFVQFAASDACASTVALVSATLDGQEFAVEEARCPITEMQRDYLSLDDMVKDVRRFSHEKPNYKVLYFDDSVDRRRKIVSVMKGIGYSSCELNSRSEPDEFFDAVASNKLKDFWFCAADSSYRTGFNFDLDCVVDSARVAVRSVVDGILKSRKTFGFESYQARGRLGRSDYAYEGLYVSSQLRGDNVIARIEGVEMSIACILKRTQAMFCGELSACGLGNGKYMLKDLSDIGGNVPLSLLPESSYMSKVVFDNLKSNLSDRQVPFSAVHGNETRRGSQASGNDLSTLFDGLMHRNVSIEVSSEIGKFYCVVGNMEIQDSSPSFPRGSGAVLDGISNGRLERSLVLLSSMDAEFVVKVLIAEMSSASIKNNAVLQLLIKVTHEDTGINALQRKYLESLRDDTAMTASRYRYLAGLLNRLRDIADVEIVELAKSEFDDITSQLSHSLYDEYTLLRNMFKTRPQLSVGDIHREIFSSGSQQNKQTGSRIANRIEDASTSQGSGSISTGSSKSSFWRVGAKTFDGRLGKLVDKKP